MAAMEAGEAAGGDRRGRQSAAMVLTTTEDFPDLNLRVDDSPEPLPELRRLLGIWRQRAGARARCAAVARQSGGLHRSGRDRGWMDGPGSRSAVPALATSTLADYNAA